MSSVDHSRKKRHHKKKKNRRSRKTSKPRHHKKQYFSSFCALNQENKEKANETHPLPVAGNNRKRSHKHRKSLGRSSESPPIPLRYVRSTTSIASHKTMHSYDSNETVPSSAFASPERQFYSPPVGEVAEAQRKEAARGFTDHINKIRGFLRQQLKYDICNGDRIFDAIRGLMPRNATRNAFDSNHDKCRHPDVICLDQGRVMLNCAEDFIHASRVPITEDGSNEIILTQLPLKNTVMDFWRMVWDENVQSILVILTQAEWNHFGKKLRLIPDWRGCLHKRDGLCIAYQQEFNVSPLWTVTFYGVSWGGSHRCVQWIHYNGWAHGKAPNETTTIWQINSYLRRSKKPVVCMSMTGAGRAGTYATLEVAHERLHNRNNHRVNLAECLQKVRDTRVHALQTHLQFNFLQMALVDHLLSCDRVRSDLKLDHIAKYKRMRTIKLGDGCVADAIG